MNPMDLIVVALALFALALVFWLDHLARDNQKIESLMVLASILMIIAMIIEILNEASI